MEIFQIKGSVKSPSRFWEAHKANIMGQYISAGTWLNKDMNQTKAPLLVAQNWTANTLCSFYAPSVTHLWEVDLLYLGIN